MIDLKRIIRVLIVDDSAFMRRAIAKMLEGEADISVVGVAATGEEGAALQLQLKPDVITMDVEMPGIGGLEAARTIIARNGPPIIMISSLTSQGADTTLRALAIGVVDFIPKPNSSSLDIVRVRADLLEKIRHFGGRSTSTKAGAAPPNAIKATAARACSVPLRPPRTLPGNRNAAFECVALGTSTGGPVALATVLPKLPANFPVPIIIVQHMPVGFTRPLAERLNAESRISVVEGEAGQRLETGTAYIAPAGQQLTLRRAGAHVEIRLDADMKKSLHVPSVDIMAAAVGDMFGPAALGVILTGMGHDGVVGLTVIKHGGGYVIGQDAASAVVYGMPRAAAVAGLVDRVVALDDIARVMCEVCNTPYSVSSS